MPSSYDFKSKFHKAPPNVPSYSSSRDLRTSCCKHNHYYILPDHGTGQSDYINKETPMSWNHNSYCAVHFADGFRNWNHFRHSRRSNPLTDAGLPRYRCPLLRLPPAHARSAYSIQGAHGPPSIKVYQELLQVWYAFGPSSQQVATAHFTIGYFSLI